MIEGGKDFAFRAEATDEFRGAAAVQFQQLYRYFFLKVSVSASRKVDRGHAAMTQLPHDHVGADSSAGHENLVTTHGRARGRGAFLQPIIVIPGCDRIGIGEE